MFYQRPNGFCFGKQVQYCCEMCRDAAWIDYHHIECGVLGYLEPSRYLGKMPHLALRYHSATNKQLAKTCLTNARSWQDGTFMLKVLSIFLHLNFYDFITSALIVYFTKDHSLVSFQISLTVLKGWPPWRILICSLSSQSVNLPLK